MGIQMHSMYVRVHVYMYGHVYAYVHTCAHHVHVL